MDRAVWTPPSHEKPLTLHLAPVDTVPLKREVSCASGGVETTIPLTVLTKPSQTCLRMLHAGCSGLGLRCTTLPFLSFAGSGVFNQIIHFFLLSTSAKNCPVRLRDLTRGGYEEQVRGYCRDASDSFMMRSICDWGGPLARRHARSRHWCGKIVAMRFGKIEKSQSHRGADQIVTFARPFTLKGVDGIFPPGQYRIVTDEELIEELSFPVYRRMATMIFVPATLTALPQSRW